MTAPPDPAALVPANSGAERPTLKTIAAATGLAIATVGRALKDAPDIGEETKRRVREVAEQMGYRPNRAGVRLRTGKTNVIALVISAESDVNYHTSLLIYAISAALRGTAYHLVVMPYFPDQDPMDPIRYLVDTRSADGIILNQTQPDDARIRFMAERGIPFASHGRTDMGLDHPYYDFDNEAFGRIALRSLAEHGRRRVLLIQPPVTQSYSRHMIAGVRAEAARHGVVVELAEGFTSDSGSEAVAAGIQVRLARPLPPDGLISGSTTAAMAAVAAMERAGRVLGHDFDLVAKEAIRMLRHFRRQMIVVREDVARAGDFLARALVVAIEKRPGVAMQDVEVPTAVESGEG